jgi:hypothetical protein
MTVCHHIVSRVSYPHFSLLTWARARARYNTTKSKKHFHRQVFFWKIHFLSSSSYTESHTDTHTQTSPQNPPSSRATPPLPSPRPPSPLPSHPSSLSTRAPRLPAFFILLLLSVMYLFINLVLVQRADGLLGALPLRVRRVPRLVALQSLFVCYLFVFG